MKCFVRPSDGSNSVPDDFPESFPGYDEAWDAINAYLEVWDLPDNAFLVEDEYGNRYRLDEKINHVLEIAPATWARLRSKYGSEVGVIDYWDIEGMIRCLEGNGFNVEAAAAAEGHFMFGCIYVPDEYGKNIVARFQDEVAKLWEPVTKFHDPLPTVRSVPIAPADASDDLTGEQVAKIVEIVSSAKWRRGTQATRKSGAAELWVGYAIAEAMGLNIDVEPADRAKASKIVDKLIHEGVLSSYNAKDAKSNVRPYVGVNK
jgi:hypothetical protein